MTRLERVGYRFMMRCLRAIEAQGRAIAKNPTLPREAKVFVHTGRKKFRNPHDVFKRFFTPIAQEAVNLLNTDQSLHATFSFRGPVDHLPRAEQMRYPHPHSHVLEIRITW